MAKTPQPRRGIYFGMPIGATYLGQGTWLEGEEFCYPEGGMTRRALAFCEFDNKLRVFKCGIPDTAFTIPATGLISGNRYTGFINIQGGAFVFVSHYPR